MTFARRFALRFSGILGFGIVILVAATVSAFNGHQVKSGGLTVLVAEIGPITAYDQPAPVTIEIHNTADSDVQGSVALRDLVDETRAIGPTQREFRLAPQANTMLSFQIALGRGAHSALYPLHAYVQVQRKGAAPESLHAVRIFETRFPTEDAPPTFAVNTVPRRGSLLLSALGTHRLAWQYFDQPVQYQPPGWTGSVADSGADLRIERVTRGEARPAIVLHPTWRGQAGTAFCEYQLKLPDVKPLRLTFANAIRDTSASEPASDGVLFRVWAAPVTAGTVTAFPGKLLYENFTQAKTWTPGAADLDEFAGQTILVRLESHPGPKKNTACDGSFWGEPVVTAGEPRPSLTAVQFAARTAANTTLGREILAGKKQPDGVHSFLFGVPPQRFAAVLTPGAVGLLDGVITLVGPRSTVSYRGLSVDLLHQPAGRHPTPFGGVDYQPRREQERAVHAHQLEKDGTVISLTITVWTDGDGLRLAWNCGERITDFALGPADQSAPALYFGHGYRVERPQAFALNFGGHSLSTSHIGVEYDAGLSVLQAVDVPPDRLLVNPAAQEYALHTHGNGTLTLVPGESGAFDCALRYRPLYDKRPSAGVPRLAGRYCFDIWGGKYADIAARLRQAIQYGLTDSFLTLHVWQRWGYDYRLPDIWPPDPQLGTLAELKSLGDLCRDQDIPWGLHDNYIDLYPDATGYSYNDIAFTAKGEPIKAWLNEGRQAQSYRWRPDRFQPALKRNLQRIKEGLAPTHYFIDVFTSIELFEFHDRQGKLHPATETRQCWGDAFAWIRDYLGDDAPMTSEAGHDQLIGWLDGADCQHLTLATGPTNAEFTLRVPCADWERVPWFDAVNHHRFIQHGVGYSGRYEGGRGRAAHGINSDDYLSDEILTGHALMTDTGSWGRQAVRKYWLAQNVARALALQKITDWQRIDNDLHRQRVVWSNGVHVQVNRGATDWKIDGATLPQYGYRVTGPNRLFSTIEKRDGVVCESATATDVWYCNARAFEPNLPRRISVKLENFEQTGPNQVKYDLVWTAHEPAPRSLTVFGHFYDAGEQARTLRQIAFGDDYRPSPPTDEWRGTLRVTRTVNIPEQATGKFYIGYGLYDQQGRLSLTGLPAPKVRQHELWVGTLHVRRVAGQPTKIEFAPPPAVAVDDSAGRVNLEKKPLDFGFVVTNGALRIERTGRGYRVVPLPDSPPFLLTLRLDKLGRPGAAGTVAQVLTLSPAGQRTEPITFQQAGTALTLRHDGTSFGYEVILK